MAIRENLHKLKSTLMQSEIAKKTLKNSSWLMAERIFTMAIGVFVTAVVARYFGPTLYGTFNYALAFVALFTALSTLGLESLTVKSIIDKEVEEGTILFTSLILRFFGGILLTGLAYGIISFLEPNDGLIHILVLIASFTMVIRSLDVIDYWIQAHQKARISSTIRMIVYVISSGLKLLIVLTKQDLVMYAFVYLLDVLLVGIALVVSYLFIKKEKPIWKFKLSYAKDVLSKSWYILLSGVMITLYMRIDQVMIGKMIASKSELGFYSAAVRIAEMWYFIPLALVTSFQPIIMAAKGNDPYKYKKALQILFTLVAWISIFFGIFITLFSSVIVNILYGSEYTQATSSILIISVWAGTFALLGSARSIWLVSEGLNQYSLYFTIFGAVTNIALNAIFIPLYGGEGAAFATLISQFVVAFMVPFVFLETRGITTLMARAFTLDVLIKKQ